MNKRLAEIIDDATIILQGGEPEWPFSRSPLANELHDFLEKIEKGKEVEKAKKDKGKMEQIDCCFIEVGVFIKVQADIRRRLSLYFIANMTPKILVSKMLKGTASWQRDYLIEMKPMPCV